MSETPLLEAVGISKRFRSRQGVMYAIDNVSFRLRAGEHLGIVGASGSGKSTVAKVVQRLMPATSGRILYAGRDVTGLRERQLRPLRRRIQSVSQNPYASLFPNKSIGQNIIEPMLLHRIGAARERQTAAMTLMEQVGVAQEQFYAFPHEISGGQQQRIAIARALALQPELLILDEAVSSLDVSIQAQILHLLVELQRQYSLTYLFVSHNLAVVRMICAQVAVMYLGRIVEFGPADEIFSRPSHPYTRALLAAVPDFVPDGPSGDTRHATVEAEPEPPSPYRLPSGCRYRTLCPIASERCESEEPDLFEVGPGHLAACHHPGGMAQTAVPVVTEKEDVR